MTKTLGQCQPSRPSLRNRITYFAKIELKESRALVPSLVLSQYLEERDAKVLHVAEPLHPKQ